MMPVDGGLVTVPSACSVEEVVGALTATFEKKGIKLFTLIDHSGEAAKVGMSMRPAKLLIFGDPRAGTPLMQASIRCAIDLPLKILVWEDEGGKTQLTYNSPAYLGWRHQLSEELLKNVAGIEGLVRLAAN